MTQFIALVHKDSMSHSGVQFPDIPGCISAADDLDDLDSNAIDAEAKRRKLTRSAFLAQVAKRELVR